MHDKVQTWLDARAAARQAKAREVAAYDAANDPDVQPDVARLRPAVDGDLVVGAVFWAPLGPGGRLIWTSVDEILASDLPRFVTEDGYEITMSGLLVEE